MVNRLTDVHGNFDIMGFSDELNEFLTRAFGKAGGEMSWLDVMREATEVEDINVHEALVYISGGTQQAFENFSNYLRTDECATYVAHGESFNISSVRGESVLVSNTLESAIENCSYIGRTYGKDIAIKGFIVGLFIEVLHSDLDENQYVLYNCDINAYQAAEEINQILSCNGRNDTPVPYGYAGDPVPTEKYSAFYDKMAVSVKKFGVEYHFCTGESLLDKMKEGRYEKDKVNEQLAEDEGNPPWIETYEEEKNHVPDYIYPVDSPDPDMTDVIGSWVDSKECKEVTRTILRPNNFGCLVIGDSRDAVSLTSISAAYNVSGFFGGCDTSFEKIYIFDVERLILERRSSRSWYTTYTDCMRFLAQNADVVIIYNFDWAAGMINGATLYVDAAEMLTRQGIRFVLGGSQKWYDRMKDMAYEKFWEVFDVIKVEEIRKPDTLRYLIALSCGKNILSSSSHHNEIRLDDYELYDYIVDLCLKHFKNKKFPDIVVEATENCAADLLSDETLFANESSIAHTISDMAGVEIGHITESEYDRLSKLEKKFHNKLIGQDEAVKVVCNAIRRGKAGIISRERPVASFLFVGPTGVGKTELCKILGVSYGGTKNSLIRFDMSEFSESHSVSKLFGSPPGYVGYDKGGALTEAVKKNSYSVILFDEIEKADKAVFDSLLQLLDAGRMTDGRGETVDFTNCIIVMTSNAGYGADTFNKKAIGFAMNEVSTAYNEKEMKAMKALEQTFKPEFLNRIDNIVIFEKITKEQSKEIVKLQFNELASRVKDNHKHKLTFTDELIDFVVEQGYDDRYNARNLKRATQTLVENKLCDYILSRSDFGDELQLGFESGEVTIKPVYNSSEEKRVACG